MNSFSKIINNTQKNLTVSFTVCPARLKNEVFPNINLCVNDKELLNGIVMQELHVSTQVRLLDAIDIKLNLKENCDLMLIKNIEIDGFNIIPNFIEYSTYITNDGIDSGPTEYLGVAGEWRFLINEPFYNWKHRATGGGWLLTP